MTRLPAVGLALLLLAAPARGQGALPYHGSEVFRFALHMKDLKPVRADSLREVITDPPGSVIVVLGRTDLVPRFISARAVRAFVDQGGAVLIATDSPLPDDWGAAFGVTITGDHLTAPPEGSYRSAPGQPFVKPARTVPGRPGPYHLFDGFEESGARALATDRPSAMRIPRQLPPMFVDDLAGYARGTSLSDGARLPAAGNHFAVSFVPPVQGGRMLMLANQSVFANGMLGFEEAPGTETGYRFNNANWEFAKRTIDWLARGSDVVGIGASRTKCLFIENGTVIDKFADELPRPPIPDLPPDVLANILLNHSNGVINELQEKNFFNRALEGFFGFPRIVRAFLIAVTALFLFYALRWLARGHRKAEPAAATSPALEAALLPRGGVLRQRTAAQIEVGNLSEAAGRRVRDRFDVLGGRPGPAGGIPPVLIATDVPDAPVLRQTVRRLWEIGYGETPVSVPPTEWDRVNGLLERVTARAARGDWSFGQDVA